MEYEKLTNFVLILLLVGMLVGVGVLALDKFGDAARESTTVSNESFIVPDLNDLVTLGNTDMIAFVQILNSSGDVWVSSNYSVELSSGILNNTGNLSACVFGDTCYAYYTYYNYDTKAATTIDASRDAIGEVSIVWLDLIVTIGILAIIIGLVIGGFYFGSRK